MSCKCIGLVNKTPEMLGANTQIENGYNLNFATGKCESYAMIVAGKVDTKSRKKPKQVYATFCPFCGKRYTAQRPGDVT